MKTVTSTLPVTQGDHLQQQKQHQQRDKLLPRLREDLSLLPAEHDEYGSPNWTIHDRVRNRYYRIGFADFEMLSRWSSGSVESLIKQLEDETILKVSIEQVNTFIRFLHANGLIVRNGLDAAQEFMRIEQAGKPPLWKWLIHHYLFIRIPLCHPDQFLQKTLWIANLFASKTMHNVILVLGIVGTLLTLRQWEHFATTFMQFANWQGVMCMAITLTSVKIFHELGHAYTAVRYGCKVPSIGLAFLVLYPVFYTDTSDAWRLTNREQKLRIGSAGIRVELAIAMIATFVWHIVPVGAVQSAAFLLATTTWISTILINLSPFMRFDGYYLLADYLRIPNLQQRAFALARWHLREILFSLGDPPPEPLSSARRSQLVLFAYFVWIYRFFLFLGIALLVYHLFFKVLGILLFIIEILWFILLPVLLELKVWWDERERAHLTFKVKVTMGLFFLLAIILLVPWNGKITAPAVLQAAKYTSVMSGSAGRVDAVFVKDGQYVEAGTQLLRIVSPELESKKRTTLFQIEAANILLAQSRSGAGQLIIDASRREQEILRLKAELNQLIAQENVLNIRAPISGIVRGVTNIVSIGTWVPAKAVIAQIVDSTHHAQVIAYVSQSDIARLEKSAMARFIPEALSSASTSVVIDRIDHLGAGVLDMPHLANIHGGAINVRVANNGILQPIDAIYKITGTCSYNPINISSPLFLSQRGSIEIHAPAISYARRFYEKIVAVFLREFTF